MLDNIIDLPFPRVGNKWLMCVVLVDLGYNQQELRRMNGVRLHQQVLFLSDVLCVRGKKIDPRVRTMNMVHSHFPCEEPMLEGEGT